MNQPIISIIVPVFNVEAYVGFCLRSILESKGINPDDFEVIIVNDGTQDNSMEIIHDVCKGRKNVTIIEQENQGLSAARMTGMAEAHGRYVWFIDSDDWISDLALSCLFQIIGNNPSIDTIVTPLLWITEDSGEQKVDLVFHSNHITEGKALLHDRPLPLWAIQRYIFKKNLADNPSLYFPLGLIHEDEYFYRVLLYLSKSVYCLKDPVYYYRQRTGSITHKVNIRSSYDIVSIYRFLRIFLKSQVAEFDYRWFQKDIVSFLLMSYKYNLCLLRTDTFRQFRKKNSLYIWKECMNCKGFTVKEKIWVSFFLLVPVLFAKRIVLPA